VSDPKTPFWKQDLSFRRKPKAAVPANAPSPLLDELEQIKALVSAAAAREAGEAPGHVPTAPVERPVPRDAAVEEEAVPPGPAPVPEEPPAKPVPIWKREVKLGRRAKVAKAERRPKQKREKTKQEKPAKPKRRRRRPSVSLKAPALRGRGRTGSAAHMPKRLVGLKIGASQIAAARVSNNGSAELLQAVREPLPPGIVVGGELREPERLAEALREFFRRHDLPRRGVRLGIANNRIGVRTFEIGGVDDAKQLDNAIRFRAQDTLPIPIEDAVLDYRILRESTGADGEPVKHVLLVVAHRELVDRYVGACRQAGIELAGIDLEAFALLRAMSAPRDDDADVARVVVSVGHERSTFAVTDGRVCEFTRVLEWGGGMLDVALARALDLAPSETQALKHALDLDSPTPPQGLTPAQLEPAKDALRRQIQAFARELVSSLHFYQNQPRSLSIGEIVLTGGTAGLRGLADELHGLIGVTVQVGDPLARVRVAKKAIDENERQIGSLAVAIGLGIDD
jgi:type IV pilus assembly protein PilM